MKVKWPVLPWLGKTNKTNSLLWWTSGDFTHHSFGQTWWSNNKHVNCPKNVWSFEQSVSFGRACWFVWHLRISKMRCFVTSLNLVISGFLKQVNIRWFQQGSHWVWKPWKFEKSFSRHKCPENNEGKKWEPWVLYVSSRHPMVLPLESWTVSARHKSEHKESAALPQCTWRTRTIRI